ncbi:MAG TPA: MGMT family protein [Gemmatimonadaceae bacterium]|nr:MGMT family protein [Gemmatimonadaceae bacterium]
MVKSLTSTHARIYATIRRIPRGKVASYGQIARLAGMPRHARLVGYALHRLLPNSSRIPWHRVVNARGDLSLAHAGRASGIEQRLRLEREGVPVNAAFRVSMARFGWRPARTKLRRGQTRTNAETEA